MLERDVSLYSYQADSARLTAIPMQSWEQHHVPLLPAGAVQPPNALLRAELELWPPGGGQPLGSPYSTPTGAGRSIYVLLSVQE